MKLINFGSLNIDYVYQVAHFVNPGETLMCKKFDRYPGGKGLNQSIALARAGVQVIHAGLIGQEGTFLKAFLANNGVEVRFVRQVDGPSGHAVIQVTPQGDNAIIVESGANHKFCYDFVKDVLQIAKPNDILLIQNEINDIPRILEQAKAHDLKVVYSVTPASQILNCYPLELVDIFIFARGDGQRLTGRSKPEDIYHALSQKYPKSALVMTLGDEGAQYFDAKQRIKVPAYPGPIVDTTADSDTFIGYFLAQWLKDEPIESCLKLASRATALCVAKEGAAVSIPYLSELY